MTTETAVENLKSYGVVGEIKPEGMEMSLLHCDGTKRYIYVSRAAIMENATKGKNHPTCIIVDDHGRTQFFHAVLLHGQVALKFDKAPPVVVDALAYMVTYGKIMCYRDPKGDPALLAPPPKPKREPLLPKFVMYARNIAAVFGFVPYIVVKNTPLLGCLIFDHKD